MYTVIGFDKIFVIDLGAEREQLDNAFRIFSNSSYNKQKYSTMALVRVANQRFRDISKACVLRVSPFRAGSQEAHATMTGRLRRRITLLQCKALIWLQPDTIPDEDMIVQVALSLNHVQILFRGISWKSNCLQFVLEPSWQTIMEMLLW